MTDLATPGEDLQANPRGRGRPPLSAEDVAERRARIVEAAARAFFASGYDETSIDGIARDAGVTKRSIYELVGDKRALFSAACNQLRAEGPHFRFDVPIEGRETRAILCDMARQLLAHSLDPLLITLERAIVAQAVQTPKITEAVVREGKVILEVVIARIFDRLVEKGQLAIDDTRCAADLFYDVAVGARGFRAVFGMVAAIDEEDLGRRVDLFLHSYSGPGDRSRA